MYLNIHNYVMISTYYIFSNINKYLFKCFIFFIFICFIFYTVQFLYMYIHTQLYKWHYTRSVINIVCATQYNQERSEDLDCGVLGCIIL